MVALLPQFLVQPSWPIFEMHLLKKKFFFPVGILGQIGTVPGSTL
jgi:hypothetical protein